ncbi:MAG: PrsW family glutamic-type intramembrane protease [Chloroflexota bacterium]
MATSDVLIDPSRRSALVWRATAALTLLIFLWQWPFFIGADLPRAGSYVVHHGYILAWLLLVTSFTRTLPLRTLAAFWFVGVFPVMALNLVIARPMDDLLGGRELAYAYLGPLVEELIKPLPVIAFFVYRARRREWNLSATDGLLLGFMVGAGFAFHEDAGYSRVFGAGFDATPWNALFPTIGYFRGTLTPYHDTLAALVGLSIGFAFLYRRYRLAWVVPVVVWLIVLAQHVTGNLMDISGRAPLPAEILSGLLLGGRAPLAMLLIGIVLAVVLEARILRSIGRRDPLFPSIRLPEFLRVLQRPTAGSLRRLQAIRVYARQRRSLYYTLWGGRPLATAEVQEMGAILYGLGIEAGVPVEARFEAYERAADAPSTEPSAAHAPHSAGP